MSTIRSSPAQCQESVNRVRVDAPDTLAQLLCWFRECWHVPSPARPYRTPWVAAAAIG
jgi:hypothetical protein